MCHVNIGYLIINFDLKGVSVEQFMVQYFVNKILKY